MENERKYCVYKHTSPSGKVYIGITKQKPEYRWRNGSGYLRKNKHGKYHQPAMANAIIKYGWDNFTHEILFEGLVKKEAESKEMELIAEYRSDNGRFGYNIEHGGNSINSFSDETKRKISESKMGEKNSMYGKPSQKRIAVVCIETGITYMCLHDAENDTDISRICISRCCRGMQKSAGKLHWRYATEEDMIAA